MPEIPDAYIDGLANMLLDPMAQYMEESPVFGPSMTIVRRLLVMFRNSEDFTVDQFTEVARELLLASKEIPEMGPMVDALAAIAGIDLND